MMNLWHIIFNKGKRKPYKRKRSTKRPAQHRKGFVPGQMEQRVRLVEPDVVEWSVVRKRKNGRKRKGS